MDDLTKKKKPRRKEIRTEKKKPKRKKEREKENEEEYRFLDVDIRIQGREGKERHANRVARGEVDSICKFSVRETIGNHI